MKGREVPGTQEVMWGTYVQVWATKHLPGPSKKPSFTDDLSLLNVPFPFLPGKLRLNVICSLESHVIHM